MSNIFKSKKGKKTKVKTSKSFRKAHTIDESHLVFGAGLSLLVVGVGRPFVQLCPQRLGLPVVQPLLQLDVEGPETPGVDVHLPAELGKVVPHILASLGLDEEVKRGMRRIDGVLARHGGGPDGGLASAGRWVCESTVEEEVKSQY